MSATLPKQYTLKELMPGSSIEFNIYAVNTYGYGPRTYVTGTIPGK